MNAGHALLGLVVALLLSGCAGLLPEVSPRLSHNAGVLALLDQAETETSAGQLPAAGASLERALRIEPRNPVLWQKLAQIRLEQGEYLQAENLAAKANALAPDRRHLRAENWRIIGQARQGLGDQPGADAAFQKMDSE
jgi:Tfp pilus assembly protein PilF